MADITEQGVIMPSQRHIFTPSVLAQSLFFYITRCGDYHLTAAYSFHFRSPIGRLESHAHSYMLFLITAGGMHVSADRQQFFVGPGQCCLFDCRQAHQYAAEPDTHFLWVHFDGTDARRFYEHIRQTHPRQPLPAPFDGFAEELRQLIHGAAHYSEQARSVRLYRFLCALATMPATSRAAEEGLAIEQALAFMEQRLFSPLTVPEIAAAVHLSPSHFSRLFRRQTGYAPHEYLTIRRLDHAQYLLSTTRMTVREVALRSGYRSEVNFICSFTAKTGLSPTDFRLGHRA